MVLGSSQKNNLYCLVYVNKKSTEKEHHYCFGHAFFFLLLARIFRDLFFFKILGLVLVTMSSGLSKLNTHFRRNFRHLFFCRFRHDFRPIFKEIWAWFFRSPK
jgi:hypothetical protein